MICDQILCGSEELYKAINDFKRSAELLAGIIYQVAKLTGRTDIVDSISRIVARHVENDESISLSKDMLTREQYEKLITEKVKEILEGRGLSDGG